MVDGVFWFVIMAVFLLRASFHQFFGELVANLVDKEVGLVLPKRSVDS